MEIMGKKEEIKNGENCINVRGKSTTNKIYLHSQ